MKKSTALPSSLASFEGFFERWGLWILTLFALLYYGSYYRAGLYPASEGGVEGMISLRLLEGERPIVDSFLGYNLLWFYPIVGLFKLFGPSYTAIRIFFLILCTLTGLMSFQLLRKCTGSARLGFLGGVLVLLIPGQMFRNYMAFIVVLNMTTLLSAYVLPSRSTVTRLLAMAASGMTLAIAWLIRVDVGFFLTCVGLGLLLIYPLRVDREDHFLDRLGVAFLGLLLACFFFGLVHLPFYKDAVRRGFGDQFVAQYEQWPAMINYQGRRLIGRAVQSASGIFARATPSTTAPATLPTPTANTATTAAAADNTGASTPSTSAAKAPKESQGTLERRSFSAGTLRDRMLALNLYLPILVTGLLLLGGIIGWLLGLFYRLEEITERSLMLLASLGCSLALFPQYFFWRPDMVHLSEFMVPMTLTILLGCCVVFQSWRHASNLLKPLLGLFLLTASLTLILYYINACQSQSSGGIAVSQNKRLDFQAANGVHVKLSLSEYGDARSIYRIISSTTVPGEYVICYPYNPEINFMTDRPSYEYNFYIDNAMIAPEEFYKETVQKIISYHPVVFVITNWDINNTEESKFKNWAWQTYDYLSKNYKLAYQHGNTEVFVRPDRADKIPKDLHF